MVVGVVLVGAATCRDDGSQNSHGEDEDAEDWLGEHFDAVEYSVVKMTGVGGKRLEVESVDNRARHEVEWTRCCL